MTHRSSGRHDARAPHRLDATAQTGSVARSSHAPSTPGGETDAPVSANARASADSQSIGRASRGVLARGVALDPAGHRAVKSLGSGNHFGTVELVRMLEHATNDVASRFEGSRLTIGDLSRATGGRLAHHRSHRSGRDADVGFYFVGDDGAPRSADQFVRVSGDGTTAQGFRFCVARNWTLLRSMIEFEGARLQYVFVSRPLQRLLLAHAEAVGASETLIERAREVMSHDARGHDNHFHVRIHCPEGDERCVDQEPRRRSRHRHHRSHAATTVASVEAP